MNTVFQRRSESMALAEWINLNLESAEHSNANRLWGMPASLGFLTTQTPFGMTPAAGEAPDSGLPW
jgi:hypothetical protein